MAGGSSSRHRSHRTGIVGLDWRRPLNNVWQRTHTRVTPQGRAGRRSAEVRRTKVNATFDQGPRSRTAGETVVHDQPLVRELLKLIDQSLWANYQWVEFVYSRLRGKRRNLSPARRNSIRGRHSIPAFNRRRISRTSYRYYSPSRDAWLPSQGAVSRPLRSHGH